MEFLTIPELSRELNLSERIVRYRLLNLIAEGKLKEHEDFRREDFRDDTHFIWRIHPMRFMAETGLKASTAPLPIANNVDSEAPPVVSKTANTQPDLGNEPVSTPPPVVNEKPKPVTNAGNNLDTRPADGSLAREFIEMLKEQIRTKDEQLSAKDEQLNELSEQLKESQDVTVKLTGAVLQQSQEIKDLLRLTTGKTEVVTKESTFATKPVNGVEVTGDTVVNERSAARYQSGNKEEVREAA
jgi:flagellar motor switch/type III secretory pathway protein FliN